MGMVMVMMIMMIIILTNHNNNNDNSHNTTNNDDDDDDNTNNNDDGNGNNDNNNITGHVARWFCRCADPSHGPSRFAQSVPMAEATPRSALWQRSAQPSPFSLGVPASEEKCSFCGSLGHGILKAETALEPPIWCSESKSDFSQTPVWLSTAQATELIAAFHNNQETVRPRSAAGAGFMSIDLETCTGLTTLGAQSDFWM